MKKYVLSYKNDKKFLAKEIADSIDESALCEGDTVVICKKCNAIMHESSWINNGNLCGVCEGTELKDINSKVVKEYEGIVRNFEAVNPINELAGKSIKDETLKTKNCNRKKIKISPKKIILSCFLIFLLIILSVVALGFNDTKEFKNALDSKNSVLINDMYSASLKNVPLNKIYNAMIATQISEIINEMNCYNFDNEAVKVSDKAVKDYAINVWGSLIYSEEAITISPSISNDNKHIWDELNKLFLSKSEYCKGLYEYKTNNDYEAAINSFIKVADNDNNYDYTLSLINECGNLYADNIIKGIDKYLEEHDIDKATELLNKIENCLSNYNISSNVLSEKIKEHYVLIDAEKSFLSRDIDTAIIKINTLIDLHPDNTIYQVRKSEYVQYLPYELYIEDNCLYCQSTSDSGHVNFNEVLEANDNSSFDHCIKWFTYSPKGLEYPNIVQYNLGDKYDTISGTLFLTKEYKDTAYSGFIEAYGDGKLIYTSKTITGGVLPQDIRFDVTGVDMLEIYLYGEGSSPYFNLADTPPRFALSNLFAQKDFPN